MFDDEPNMLQDWDHYDEPMFRFLLQDRTIPTKPAKSYTEQYDEKTWDKTTNTRWTKRTGSRTLRQSSRSTYTREASVQQQVAEKMMRLLTDALLSAGINRPQLHTHVSATS